MILGDSYITFNRKLSNFRGHYVPLESKFRGHLDQKRAKSPFFEGQGKPCIWDFFQEFGGKKISQNTQNWENKGHFWIGNDSLKR